MTGWLPFGVAVGADSLTALSWAVIAAGLVAVPVAYRTSVRRVDADRLD